MLPGVPMLSPGCLQAVPKQHIHVVGTEQALVAVGDAVGAADGADGLAADRHLLALLICGVGIGTAVHLPEESQQQDEKTWDIQNAHFCVGH